MSQPIPSQPHRQVDLTAADPTASVSLREALNVPNSLDGVHTLLCAAQLFVELGDREGATILLGHAMRLIRLIGGQRA